MKILGSLIQDILASPLPPIISSILVQVQAVATPLGGAKRDLTSSPKKSGIDARGPLAWIIGVICRSLSYPNSCLSEKVYGISPHSHFSIYAKLCYFLFTFSFPYSFCQDGFSSLSLQVFSIKPFSFSSNVDSYLSLFRVHVFSVKAY